jgi:hypothetical protein
MSKLIAALQIFLKYGDPVNPTNCSHDVLTICGIDPKDVSKEDKAKLSRLGFFINKEEECFQSFRFGSC